MASRRSLPVFILLLALTVTSCGATAPSASDGTTEPATDGISLSFVMVGVTPQQFQNSTLQSVIAVVAGTDPSAVAIDNVQYQVTVDLTQNPSGERRRLLADGYSVLLVSATVRAVNLAAVETALTAGDAPSKLDGALRQQIGSTLTAGTLKVTAPTWATTTAPAPATSAPVVGIQFVMSGVSAAQLNQTELRMAVAELAGVPLAAVAIARISYEVALAPAPAPGRRLRRLLASDGYSHPPGGSDDTDGGLQVSNQVLISASAQTILARLLESHLGATYVSGSLQLVASASITDPAPGPAPVPIQPGGHGITRAEIIATAVIGGCALLALSALALALWFYRRVRCGAQVTAKDDESEDMELGQRIASKLSAGKGSPVDSKEPELWINSSVFVDRTDAQSPAGRVTVGVKSSPSVKELTESCAEDVRPAPNGWILNVYAAAVTPEPVPAPAPRNNH